VLAQAAVPDKTNDAGGVSPVLATLSLANETVTFDAAFAHYAVASQVVQGGASVLVIEGNQPSLLREAEHTTSWPARFIGDAQVIHWLTDEWSSAAWWWPPPKIWLATCPPGAPHPPPPYEPAHGRRAEP
jgi:hypothetical protein